MLLILIFMETFKQNKLITDSVKFIGNHTVACS